MPLTFFCLLFCFV